MGTVVLRLPGGGGRKGIADTGLACVGGGSREKGTWGAGVVCCGGRIDGKGVCSGGLDSVEGAASGAGAGATTEGPDDWKSAKSSSSSKRLKGFAGLEDASGGANNGAMDALGAG